MYSGSALADLKAELTLKESGLSASSTTVVHAGGNGPGNSKKNKTFEKIQGMTNSKKKKRRLNDTSTPQDQSDDVSTVIDQSHEVYEKAHQKLLAKTKIYDKMQKGQMEDVEDFRGETRYLVDFHQKTYGSSSSSPTSSSKLPDEPDDYQNCKDEKSTLPGKRTIASAAIFEANEEHREKLHEKWRAEQDEILNGPVHYENIKFDEIRNLGTGYFAFSKDEEQRQKQLEELQNMHKQTISVQQRKEQLKEKRKTALQQRLQKVKERKAKERGEPFVGETNKEVDDQPVDADHAAHENNHNAVHTATNTDTSELASLNESILRECRKDTTKPVREWDKGKLADGMKQPVTHQPFVRAKQKPSTTTNSFEKALQERRSERPEEFAPPGFY